MAGGKLENPGFDKRIIALNADWNTLYSIYSDYSKEDKIFSTDNLLSGEDPYSKFYEYVENIISAFENNSYGELYRIFKISLGQEKYKNNLPRFKGGFEYCVE